MTRVAMSFLVLASIGATWGQDLAKVTLCELLENPERYNGQLVEVTSETLPALGELDFRLEGAACARGIDTGAGVKKQVVLTSSRFAGSSLRPAFEWDPTSQHELYEAGRRLDESREKLIVTVVGLFETRLPLNRLLKKYSGFGNLGLFPAQILVQRIVRIEVRSK